MDMENKQTAVEWLFEKLWDEPKDKFTWYALREKAIQMEKERIEISDDEIEKAAENYGWKIKTNTFSNPVKANELAESAKQDFIEGAKWYREQLKKK